MDNPVEKDILSGNDLPYRIDTVCRDCLFAKYNGPVQIGCEVNKLDIFREQNIEIEEVQDAEGGLEYFYLHDKLCNSFRTPDWIEKINKNFKVDKFEALKREQTLSYAYIIYDDGGSFDDLAARIKELAALSIKPRFVGIVLQNLAIDCYQISKLIETELSGIKYKITTLLDENKTSGIDILVDNNSNRFVGYFKSGFTSPVLESFLNKISTDIYTYQKFLGYVEYKDYTFTLTAIHSYFQGYHFGKALKEKIIDQNHSYIIHTYEDINSL